MRFKKREVVGRGKMLQVRDAMRGSIWDIPVGGDACM